MPARRPAWWPGEDRYQVDGARCCSRTRDAADHWPSWVSLIRIEPSRGSRAWPHRCARAEPLMLLPSPPRLSKRWIGSSCCSESFARRAGAGPTWYSRTSRCAAARTNKDQQAGGGHCPGGGIDVPRGVPICTLPVSPARLGLPVRPRSPTRRAGSPAAAACRRAKRRRPHRSADR